MIKARYTCVLKTLLDDPTTKAEIDRAMSTYPLYVQKSKNEFIEVHIPTREELNKKILNHYKYKEIGFVAPGRFIDELEIALNEIMPYYNQLMMTIDQDYNFLYNADYTREYEGTRDGTSELFGTNKNVTEGKSETSNQEIGSSRTLSDTQQNVDSTATTNADNKNVNIDTPQGIVTDITGASIDDITHASSVAFNQNNGYDSANSTSDSFTDSKLESSGESSQSTFGDSTSEDTKNENVTSKDIEKHIERVRGNYGQVSMQSLIRQYRELIINIEQRIIRDHRIEELFMSIF